MLSLSYWTHTVYQQHQGRMKEETEERREKEEGSFRLRRICCHARDVKTGWSQTFLKDERLTGNKEEEEEEESH